MSDDKGSTGRRPSALAGDDLAPVIPLFGGARSAPETPETNIRSGPGERGSGAHPAFGRERLVLLDSEAAEPVGADADDESDAREVRERAEALLLCKLRSRSLSISEARAVLRGVEGADGNVVEETVEHLVDLGYLDDAAFADQLVMSAVERRGDGRRAVAETLRKHGIPRDIADAALEALPDDDAERALEFARSKARSVGGKDDDASLRRLAGQLARRGYPSSVALSAARTALQEVGVGRSRPGPRPLPGVRFTPDD